MSARANRKDSSMKTVYRFQAVGDVDVFYREGGAPDAPVETSLSSTSL